MFLRAYNLRMQSQVPIPGAQPSAQNDKPDLRILLEPEEQQESGGHSQVLASSGPYHRRNDGSLVFQAPLVGRFTCSADATVLRVQRAQGAADADLTDFLTATALPMVLWLRGEIVLHAATAILPGCRQGLAFAGASGAGKSTLLRALLAQDCYAVGDDTLCLRNVLPASAAEASGLPACTLSRAADPAAPRLATPVPPEQQSVRCTLGALLVLDPSLPAPAPPRRLSAIDALQALLRNLHRPRIPALLGSMPTLLPRLAVLCTTLPVYLWNPNAWKPSTGQPQDLHLLRGLTD